MDYRGRRRTRGLFLPLADVQAAFLAGVLAAVLRTAIEAHRDMALLALLLQREENHRRVLLAQLGFA